MLQLDPSSRVVLTGPSGWIGTAMLNAIADQLGGCLNGRVTAFASSARMLDMGWGEQLEVRPLSTITPADVAGAHVVHLAYLTKEKAELLGQAAFDATNEAIDEALHRAIEAAAPASLFVASSGAASLAERGEDDHPYGRAKLRQEERFLSWARLSGVPTIAGRIYNLAGPYINKVRSYAISDFAMQAQETGEIRISAAVPVFRSYLHVSDLCALVLGAARMGLARQSPIDLSGAEAVEMADIAHLVAQTWPAPPPIRREPVNFARPSLYLGDPTHARILAMELDETLRPLVAQVADTIEWLRQGALPRQGSATND